MKSFIEYLTEGRDAPLYHGTMISYANKIVKSQVFLDNTYQSLHLKDGFAKDVPQGYSGKNGTSFTRSYKFAKSFQETFAFDSGFVIFEMNQRKLAQNYKFVPINFYSSGVGMFRDTGKARFSSVDQHKDNEYEEFVIGKIKNVDRYITKIHIPNEQAYHRITNEATPFDEVGDLRTHPKLFYKGEFINAKSN